MIDGDDEADDWNPSASGPEGLRVMREQCPTCIFRPDNPMQLRRGRVADMTRETDRADTNVTCHQTLGTDRGVLCRGSVDRRPGQMVRIAERLGALVEVDS